ncbi:MAG: hypothetical protein ACJ77V_10900 [Chloroflexota bacterium]|jgi:hypothetical protein
MDARLVAGVILAAGGVLFILAGRRRGSVVDVDLDLIPFGSAVLTGIFLTTAGVMVLGRNTIVGLAMLAVGAVAIGLAARMAWARRTSVDAAASKGELSRPAQDYLVWTVLGVPILVVVVFVVLAVGGGLDRH